ncbi:MAG: cation transporter [Proteobacteria bacterium]|nr:cation transporter [Pseudomonadota bacterium]
MADCCEKEMDVTALEAGQRKVLLLVMIINFCTFGGMVIASWLSQSSALLSGTLDNLGDALTYALSLAVVGAGVMAKAKVAVFKGLLIGLAALGVAIQIIWRLYHLDMPLVTTMGIAAILNLLANGLCLMLLTPHRHDDVNMSSVWECSRNDVFEGLAVIATAGLVWLTQSGIPDVLVATLLLAMFCRSAFRVMSSGIAEYQTARA